MAATMMSTFARANVHVAAVVSRDAKRAQKFASAFHIPIASGDLGAALSSDEFDAVYIANASVDHAMTAIAALQAGKAVLCEKPFAVNANEGNGVSQAARASGRLCMEGLWTAFLPAYRHFIELARTERYGKPAHLFADFGYPVGDDLRRRVLSPTASGVLLDRGIYLVALALDIFGTVERVSAEFDRSANGVDQHVSLQLFHRNGGQSQLSASYVALMSNSAALACSKGMICLGEPLVGTEMVLTRQASVAQSLRDPAEPLGKRASLMRSLREHSFLRRLKRSVDASRRQHFAYGPDPYLPQLQHFLGLLETGANQSGVLPLDSSLETLKVIDRARIDPLS